MQYVAGRAHLAEEMAFVGGPNSDDQLDLGSTTNFCCPNQTTTTTTTTTLLLVGRTGNGKSATGNSILGRNAFNSKSSSSGVTTDTLLQTAAPSHLGGNHIIRVIDTPGLFEVLDGSDSIVEEIVKCAELGREGIHAILVVLTTRSRFSIEELAALGSLQALFGDKMVNYMILIFTGGDDLEADGESLQDYLGPTCPHALKEVVAMCGNRCISFDNRTSDEGKKQEQVKRLMHLVDEVMMQNGGKPYGDEMFDALKRNAITVDVSPEIGTCMSRQQQVADLEKKLAEAYEQQLTGIRETIELKLKEVTSQLEKQLADERKATAEAQKTADLAAKKAMEDIERLRKDLMRSQSEADQLRNHVNNIKCAIM